jgi:membrane protease YdiL (CAAX protease family)
MTPGMYDHVLAAAVLVLFPALGARAQRDLAQLIAERGSDARRIVYHRIIASQWALGAATLGVWAVRARPWPDIGISQPHGWGFAAVLAITVAILSYCGRQLGRVRREPEFAEATRTSSANLTSMLPSTPAELRHFTFVCATAGIVEELVFRGFLLWYLGIFVPLWAAMLVAALAFGIGHLYQGVSGGLQTGVAALIFSGMYVLSGSLWLPMLLHGVFNYLQVRTIYDAHRGPASARPSSPG